MIRMQHWLVGAGVLAVTMASAPAAQAAIVVVQFAGVLSSATNNPSPAPGIPAGSAFFVGQSFSGSVSYDTAAGPGTTTGTSTTLPIIAYNIVIGGVDYSSRFLPRLVGHEANGQVTFLTGGASQGGSSSLTVNLAPFATPYPTAAQLNGQTAAFLYQDFQPLGGSVAGTAFLSAVPEPATWGMMILGFGTIGLAMRRRTRVRVAYA